MLDRPVTRRAALTAGGILSTAMVVGLIWFRDSSGPSRVDPSGRSPAPVLARGADAASDVIGVPSPEPTGPDRLSSTPLPAAIEGGTVSGRVLAEDGTPVPGVWLSLQGSDLRVVTRDDGSYGFRGLEREAIVTVRCEESGEMRSCRSGQTGLDFVLSVYVARIRLQPPAGTVVPDARISYSLLRDGDEIGGGTLAVPHAGASLAVPSGAALRVDIQIPGFRRETRDLAFEGASGARGFDIPLLATEETGEIQILVRTESGNPLGKVYLSLSTPAGAILTAFSDLEVPLDQLGTGLVESVPAGEYGLALSAALGPAHLSRFECAIESATEVLAGRVARVEARFREGGWVRIRCARPDGTVLVPPWLELLSDSVPLPRVHFLGELAGDWVYPSRRAGPVISRCPLPPGQYGLRHRPAEGVSGEWTVSPVSVIVRPREVTDIDLVLER